MNRAYVLILFLITCFLPGCFSHGKVRQFRADNRYPDSEYLKAEGLGQSEGEAKKSARSELSNIFESRVSSDTISNVSRVLKAGGEEEINKFTASNIRVVSRVELKGVEIAGSWRDEKEGVYRAIAVLDRKKARSIWSREIENIDRKIKERVKSVSSIRSDFAKMTALRAAAEEWLSREVLVSRLSVIGSSYTGMEDYDISRVYRDIAELRKGMTVFIDFDGVRAAYRKKGNEEISMLLTRDAGYPVVTEMSRAKIVIKGKVNVNKVDLNNPDYKFARVSLSLIIKDNGTGEVVGEFTEKKRSGHINFDEAAHKAFYKTVKSIKKDLLAFF